MVPSSRRVTRLSTRATTAIRILVALLLGTAVTDAANGEDASTGQIPARTAFVNWKMDEHPSLRLGIVKLDFKTRIESDERAATPAIGLDTSHLAWQHPRVGIEGAISTRVRFEVSRDLGTATRPWKDVYVEFRPDKRLFVVAGRFKMPFGRDALTGRSDLDFVVRSLAGQNLSPSRDTGVMGRGRFFGHGLEYEVGYFVHDGDFARTASTVGARDSVAARLRVTPMGWSSAAIVRAWQIGLAITESHLDDQLGLRGRSVFDDSVFFNHIFVNGRRQRIGLESSWAHGPVSIAGEYITVAEQRRHMGFSSEDLPAVLARSWYLAGTWTLTGERKKGRIEPDHPLLVGGFGAVELVARVEALRFDDVVYPGTAFGFPASAKLSGNNDRAVTLGFNWYLNRFLRLQGNTVLEAIADPSRSPAPSTGARFRSAVLRTQFVL